MKRREHVLSCDDYHAHHAPQCCADTCWCHVEAGKMMPWPSTSADGQCELRLMPKYEIIRVLERKRAWCEREIAYVDQTLSQVRDGVSPFDGMPVHEIS